jgi:hypothetical protein
VLALIQAPGLVDANPVSQASGLGELLQLGEQFALAIAGTRWAGSAFRTDIMANKNMVLKQRQTDDPPQSRLIARRGLASFHNIVVAARRHLRK